jgi:hypothetical protein
MTFYAKRSAATKRIRMLVRNINYFQDMGTVEISQNQTLPARSMTT